MTREELRALLAERTTVPFLASLDAIGVSETAGRKALLRGELPFRVIRVGSALRVPSVDLEALLLTPNSSEAGPASPAIALTDEPHGGPHDDGRTTHLPLRSA